MSDPSDFKTGKSVPTAGSAGRSHDDILRTKELIQQLEEQRRLVLDAASLGWWQFDPVARTATLDSHLADIFGLAEGVPHKASDIFERIHPDDRDQINRAVTAALDPENPQPYRVEYRLFREDGQMRWIASIGQVTFADGPAGRQAVSMVGTGADVTDARTTAQALRESELYFRRLADAMPQIVFIADADGNIDYFNERWYEYTGFSREEGIGEKAWRIVHDPDLLESIRERWLSSVRSGQPYEIEYPLRRADGTFRWHLGRALPVRDAAGNITRWFGTNTDIHDQKMIQQALRNSEARYRLTARATNNAIWDWDLTTDVVLWNEALHTLFGHELRDGCSNGKWWIDHIHPDDRDRIVRSIHEVIDHPTREGWQDEYRFGKSDGLYADVLDRGYVLRDSGGKAIRMVGAMQDLSEHKRIDREREGLLKAERVARTEAERASQLKDEFLATLSHELRTPLNAILGWAQIIRMGSTGPEDVAQAMEVIERNARAQAQIIEDLLDMSRIIAGKVRLDVQRTDLTQIIQAAIETAQPAARAKGIRLRTMLDPLAGPTSGDPNRLQQVLWNLLSNSIKFTPKGGSVKVILERVNSHIEISVIDTGEGIKPEFLPHVFDRFRQANSSTTRQVGGLGLGLAIVKQLVELHGGSIHVKSPGENQGATFTVMLPQTAIDSRPDVAPERRHPRGTTAPLKLSDPCVDIAGVHVLVVDDEPDARVLIRRLLEDCNAKVTTAASADEALELLTEHSPDLIVSDVGMPVVDGYTLIQRIRALPSTAGGKTPAIALTAYARAEDRVKAILAGFNMHLAKPVEPNELIAMVASLTRKE